MTGPMSKAMEDMIKESLEKSALEKERIIAEAEAVTDEDRVFNKLKYPPPKPTLPPIIMPIIRKIMPAMIANELIGIQPMTCPEGGIFTMNRPATKPKEPNETE